MLRLCGVCSCIYGGALVYFYERAQQERLYETEACGSRGFNGGCLCERTSPWVPPSPKRASRRRSQAPSRVLARIEARKARAKPASYEYPPFLFSLPLYRGRVFLTSFSIMNTVCSSDRCSELRIAFMIRIVLDIVSALTQIIPFDPMTISNGIRLPISFSTTHRGSLKCVARPMEERKIVPPLSSP